MDAPAFTPVEKRMLSVLADGEPHPRKELRACLADELGDLKNIRTHLSNIRKKLRPAGEYVVCELSRGTIAYRRVRLIGTSA